MNMRLLPLLLAAFYGLATQVQAQLPIVPEWIRTWAYGQGPADMLIQPVSGDNHVAVDATTGIVYCTVSDVPGDISWQNELLFAFDTEGTPTGPADPAPLNAVHYDGPSEDLSQNPHSTTDLSAFGGRLLAAHAFQQSASWNEVFSFGTAQQRRTLVPGIGGPQLVRNARVAMDADHLLFLDNPSGFLSGHLFCNTTEGWPKWRVPRPSITDDLMLHDGIAYLSGGSTIFRHALTDGAALPVWSSVGPAERIAAHGAYVHHTGFLMDQLVVTRRNLDGTASWQASVDPGGPARLTGMVVDDIGRTWISLTLLDAMGELEQEGRLHAFGPAGQWLAEYRYGRTINGLARHDDRLFLTGWSSDTETETYLIGVGSDELTTVHEKQASDRPFVWPQPTHGNLNDRLHSDAHTLSLIDPSGRVVRTWNTNGLNLLELDLADLSAGAYVLRADQGSGAPVILR